MLANALRMLVILGGGFFIVLAAYGKHSGDPWLLSKAVVVVLGSYLAILAVEFLVVLRVNRHDPVPRVRLSDLALAWWRESTYAPRIFCWRQPFQSQRWTDQLRSPDPTKRQGVVFIHGYVCNRGLWTPWLQRMTALQVPFVAVDLEPVLGSIDDYVGVVESAVSKLERATGKPPIVVAHSMGGLALRRWWVEGANVHRVEHVITLGTPHSGTWLASLSFTPNGRQMRRGSKWLAALAARESPDHAKKMTCFYSHCDNIVIPASTATIHGADNRHLSAVPHVQMVDDPAPMRELTNRLSLRE